MSIPTSVHFGEGCNDLVTSFSGTPAAEVSPNIYAESIDTILFQDEFFEIEVYLSGEGDENDEDVNGDTMLMRLIRQGCHAATIALLVRKGACLETQNQYGETALIFATKFSNHSAVMVLLAHGAEVERKTHSGWTPLMYACEQCDEVIAESLISYGADANAVDIYGFTPLLMNRGNAKIAELLLQSGADVHAQDNYTDTLCVTVNLGEMCRCYLSHPLNRKSVDARKKFNKVPNITGVIHNDHGWSALMWAAFFNWTDVARVLLSHGAVHTQLHTISSGGRTPFICMFLDRNAWEAIPGSVPRDLSMLRLFVEYRVYINKSDRKDYSALTYACEYNRQDVAEYLIANGAIYATISKQLTSPKLLGPLNRYIHDTWLEDGLHRIVYENGTLQPCFKGDIDARDKFGWTSLHVAIFMQRLELAAVLLIFGADVFAMTPLGQTPLHLALARHNEVYAVKDRESYGVDINTLLFEWIKKISQTRPVVSDIDGRGKMLYDMCKTGKKKFLKIMIFDRLFKDYKFSFDTSEVNSFQSLDRAELLSFFMTRMSTTRPGHIL